MTAHPSCPSEMADSEYIDMGLDITISITQSGHDRVQPAEQRVTLTEPISDYELNQLKQINERTNN